MSTRAKKGASPRHTTAVHGSDPRCGAGLGEAEAIWGRKRQLKAMIDELYAAYARYRDAKQQVDDICHQIVDWSGVSITALRLLIEERNPCTEREQQHLNELLD